MKKITHIEIFVLFLVFLGFAFYVVPQIMLSTEKKQYGRLQTNVAMMTSKILAEFSDNKNKKQASEIANNLAGEMNKLVKNPIDRKNAAYSINDECLGCVVLIPDDKIKTIVLTAKDKTGELIARTVIKPPSYVTFNKDLNSKNDRK